MPVDCMPICRRAPTGLLPLHTPISLSSTVTRPGGYSRWAKGKRGCAASPSVPQALRPCRPPRRGGAHLTLVVFVSIASGVHRRDCLLACVCHRPQGNFPQRVRLAWHARACKGGAGGWSVSQGVLSVRGGAALGSASLLRHVGQRRFSWSLAGSTAHTLATHQCCKSAGCRHPSCRATPAG